MTLSLMLCSVMIAAVLTVAATVLHTQERAANRPVRWIWSGAILLTVLLTAIVPLRERFGVIRTRTLAPSLVIGMNQRALEALPRKSVGSLSLRVRAGVDAAVSLARHALQAAANVRPTVQRAIMVAWALCSIVSLGLLCVVYRRVRRTASTWQRAHVLGTDVRVSESAGPAVIGINPMEIVLPSWVLRRSPDEQDLVLRHELEHVRAHDPALLVGACLAVAVMPWNPLLWYALSRLRLAVEIDCDRRVLQRGVAPLVYGRLLLELSAHPSSLSNALPALSYHTSHLERRLLAMTARPARFVIARRVSGGLVAAAALLAACESKLPTSAEVESMDATKAVAQASKLPGIDSSRTVFVVDGRAVSGAEAKSYEASRIASIEVVKGADRTAQVRLRTKGPDSLTLTGTKMRFMGDSSVVAEGVALAPTMRTPLRSKTGFDGIFVIDGKIVSNESANALSPDRIESVEVIKGEAATKAYPDPRAVNGVIKITTKK